MRSRFKLPPRPADKTYANQLKGAAILEPIFVRQPQHPGVAHYLIHLYDYPPIADKGLKAARRYAKIAPGRRARATHAVAYFHARRILAGVRSRANAVSQRVAKEASDFHDHMDATDDQVYAYLQLGQDREGQSRSR